jgi:hypothetical protein
MRARIAELEALLAQPTECPLPGQEAIPVATIGHHAYEGPGPCRADLFGTLCGEHRHAHQLIDDEDA